MHLKTYFFIPFVRRCVHHNYGVISGSHACRDCVWNIILDAELYTTYPGKRVLVPTRFNVTILPLRLCYEKTRACFSKDAEIQQHMVTCFDAVRLFVFALFFEHYNRILLCEWVIEHCSVCLIDGVSCHNAFAFYLDSTNLGIGALLRSSVVTSVTC